MKKNVMNANASIAEAKALERMNTFFEVFDLEPSQYKAAKIAIDYAVKKVVDPENHEDAVLGTAFDFLSGFEYARNTRNKSVNYMEIIEEVMLSKGVKAALDSLAGFAEEGNADATYLLAEIYLRGELCNQDESKGFRYLQLAIQQGSVKALVRFASIGMHVTHKKGVNEEDENAIITPIHEAALMGHPEAEMILSLLYYSWYEDKGTENIASLWKLKASIDGFDQEKVLELMGYEEELKREKE